MAFALPPLHVSSVLPELVLLVTASAVVIVGICLPRARAELLGALSLAGMAAGLLALVCLWGEPVRGFGGMVVKDGFALFFCLVLLVAGGISTLMSFEYLRREGARWWEYHALMLLSLVGMMLMASATDLIMVFLGLETFSLSIYVLAGFLRHDPRSGEAALKYFLLGSFASAFFLYGVALLYGITGSTNLARIATRLAGSGDLVGQPMLLAAMCLLVVGFGFKIALAPFHMWVPDVYEGAPTSVTAFMSVAPKAAGFAAFLRVFLRALPSLRGDWTMLLWVLAVLTMSVGNLVAISQRNIVRMLAYSSIAHAGYLLVGMVAGGNLGTSSVLFYLWSYAFMNLGAFAVVVLYGRAGRQNLQIEDYAGMAHRYPVLAAAMALFMFSLAGIPPTAGFVGKFYLFSAAVKAGYIWLAVIGVINSLVSVYYYLRVTVMMYMRQPEGEVAPVRAVPSLSLALLITALFTLQIGLFPGGWLRLAHASLGVLP